MKLALVGLLVALPLAGAFAPAATKKMALLRPDYQWKLSLVAREKPQLRPRLTLQILLKHDKRSVTVTKDQFVSQMQQIQKEPELEPVDLSVLYDAPAKLAYESSDKSLAYGDFKTKYEADAVAYVTAKKSLSVVAEVTSEAPADLSDDAPARLAYESSDKSMSTYGAFKIKFEADAIAEVIAKKTAAATPAETKEA
jgi:hypothetical protein